MRAGLEHHIDKRERFDELDDSAGFVAKAGALGHQAEAFPKHVRQEANQDVGLHAILALMKDWPERQILFVDAEGGLSFRELDVCLPELLGRPVADIGPQEITAFAHARPLGVFRAAPPVEHRAIALGLDGDRKERCCAAVCLEQAPDAAPDTLRFFGPASGAAGLERREALGQPLAEALVHRLFLLLPGGTAAKDKRLVGAKGGGTELHLQTRVHLVPVALQELRLKPLQQTLGRADNVSAALGAEQAEVRLARHAAVHDPDTVRFAVERLHFPHDLVDCFRVVPVAFEGLEAEGDPFFGNDQRDADLLTVEALIPGVAALGLGVARGKPLKIG